MNARDIILKIVDMQGGFDSPQTEEQFLEFLDVLTMFYQQEVSAETSFGPFLYVVMGHAIAHLLDILEEETMNEFNVIMETLSEEDRGNQCVGF